MTCLACGLPTALAAIASPHPLGGLLCVAHLVLALSSDKPTLSPVRVQPVVPRDRCWHEGITCPRPVAWEGINSRLCALHAPPLYRARPALARGGAARPSDKLADDGMADAVLAVVAGLHSKTGTATILDTRPGYYGTLDPLEGNE